MRVMLRLLYATVFTILLSQPAFAESGYAGDFGAGVRNGSAVFGIGPVAKYHVADDVAVQATGILIGSGWFGGELSGVYMFERREYNRFAFYPIATIGVGYLTYTTSYRDCYYSGMTFSGTGGILYDFAEQFNLPLRVTAEAGVSMANFSYSCGSSDYPYDSSIVDFGLLSLTLGAIWYF